jgi:hypothetical protein
MAFFLNKFFCIYYWLFSFKIAKPMMSDATVSHLLPFHTFATVSHFCHRFALLPPFRTFANFYHFCQRLPLLPPFTTFATVYHFCHRLPLLPPFSLCLLYRHLSLILNLSALIYLPLLA